MAPRELPFSASSTALSYLVVIGLFLIGFLPLISRLPEVGAIGTPLRPLTETSDQEPPEGGAPEIGDSWTEAEIVRGREECMHVLQSVAADVEVVAPIKRADCGLPAPVRLKSLGSSSKVVFEPPVEVNCRLIAALYRWNKDTLQPAARNRLGAPVARILGASGYSCRNVYNLPDGHLSQHAFANAIDIAAFELQDGRSVTVLNGWGPTARDVRAQAKVKSELASSKSPAAKGKNTTAKSALPASGQVLRKANLSLKTPPEQKPGPPASRPIGSDVGVGVLTPTPATKFLSILHRGACQEFETVLGPEANEAHRNHFHFDLTPLRGHTYCE